MKPCFLNFRWPAPIIKAVFGLVWLCSAANTVVAQQAENPLQSLGVDFFLYDTEVLFDFSDSPPQNLNWQSLELPLRYRELPNAPQEGTAIIWYRFKLSSDQSRYLIEASADDYIGVYIGRHLNSVEVFYGQDFIGSSGPDYGYTPRNWNHSVVWEVPKILMENNPEEFIYLRQYGYDGIGLMPPLGIGNYRKLEDFVAHQNQRQVKLGRAVWVLEIMMAILCGFIWMRRRDRAYLYLALTAVFSSLGALYSFSQAIPLHQDTALRIVHWGGDASICALILFARNLLGVPFAKFDKFLIIYPVVLIFVSSLVPAERVAIMLNALHLVTLALLGYLLIQAVTKAITEKQTVGWILAAGISLMFASFFHGVSLSLSQDIHRWATEFHTNYLSMLPLLVLLLLHISRHFILGMRQLNDMNSELSDRVELVRAELSAAHKARLRKEKVIASEQAREAAYRDLHDDLGARILSLVYSADQPARADLARSALQDLRDVVSRISKADSSLMEVLADCNFELDDRASRLQAQVTWSEYQNPQFERKVSAEYGLYLKQFFRELFGSVVRQSGANDLCIECKLEGSTLAIRVLSVSLTAADQEECITSYLLLRLRKLKGRITRESSMSFDMEFSLQLR